MTYVCEECSANGYWLVRWASSADYGTCATRFRHERLQPREALRLTMLDAIGRQYIALYRYR